MITYVDVLWWAFLASVTISGACWIAYIIIRAWRER